MYSASTAMIRSGWTRLISKWDQEHEKKKAEQ